MAEIEGTGQPTPNNDQGYYKDGQWHPPTISDTPGKPETGKPETPPEYDHRNRGDDGGGTGGTGGTGGSGGGSDGGGGSSSTEVDQTGYKGPGKDYNDADDSSRFLGIAGHPEVWKDSTSGQMFIVHFAEGVEPPVPLLFEVPDEKTLQAFFGEGVKIVYDKTMKSADMDSTGAVKFGTTNNLDDSEGDPWVGFLDRIERLKEVSPWVEDDEILALIGGAYLEDRDIEDWELKTTDWWQGHNEQERKWLSLSMGDPASAERKIADDRLYTTSLFEKIGAEGNDPALINWMANQYTTGAWSQKDLAAQIEAITSGWGVVDEGLNTWMEGKGFDTSTSEQHFDRVRELWDTWLGPAYTPEDERIAEWATKIRNTADGEDSLIEMLRAQRLALFPEYENPALSWKDISAPWKALSSSMWGVPVEEADPFFQDVVRLNNGDEAQQMLRKAGFERGYDKVVNDMMNGIGSGSRNSRGVV